MLNQFSVLLSSQMIQLKLSIDDHVADALDSLAASKSLSSEELVRDVISRFVRSNDRLRIHNEMRSYAEEMAAGSSDFVAESGAEVDDQLIQETQW
jgi:metal-responsive CopG/Arc/MetJ family transcriptional regulator